MKITAAIEVVPSDHSGSTPAQVREISVEAATYEESTVALQAEIPEAWRLMNLRRESD